MNKRFVAESGVCGKQPPAVERTESHRIKKERVFIVADDERSERRHIESHTIIDPGEDGDAVRSRCRASPAAGAPGCAEHPGRNEHEQTEAMNFIFAET